MYKPYCKEIGKLYQRYRGFKWSNTRFGLVPGGRQPMSYRLAESILNEIIPVIVIPYDAVLPDNVPWSKMSFRFSPDEIHRIVPTLKEVSDKQYHTMKEELRKWKNETLIEHIIMRALTANLFQVKLNHTVS